MPEPRALCRPPRPWGVVLFVLCIVVFCAAPRAQLVDEAETLNRPAAGFRGIWYANQPSDDQYRFKYSGGLGTYCAKHRPFAVHCAEVDKTFFCYGAAAEESDRQLLHAVSFFDHTTGEVARPVLVVDKKTSDAHDNPVLAVDGVGYLWLFSTSHGRARRSYVHRSREPWSIAGFERVDARRLDDDGVERPLDNFSYLQVFHVGEAGFQAFFTRYRDPVARTSLFMTSADGVHWSRGQRLAAMGEGHYQIGRATASKAAACCNVHPTGKGLNARTNLYYLETVDGGGHWRTATGEALELPLTETATPALVHDYAAEGRLVYLKDLQFDARDRPVILYVTSTGYAAGPANGPREWKIARFDGSRWIRHLVTTSDNNYDMGSLRLSGDTWEILAPTDIGPQPFNPGGEVVRWQSRDRGETWERAQTVTAGSPFNHTYVRTVERAHRDFVALWADGHGREPSASRLYLADADGRCFRLPEVMEGDRARPEPVVPGARPAPWEGRPVHEVTFDQEGALDGFSLSDPAVWTVDGGALVHRTGSTYRPVHRSPLNLAVLEGTVFGSFSLSCEVEQTGRDYGHRDLCLFFGIQDREHFYYAHLATSADPNAHHVQLVDGAARRPITARRNAGIDWGRGETRVLRLERDVVSGRIAVYFGDLEHPVLEACDTTFGAGRVGLGSFDDEGRFEWLRIQGDALRSDAPPLFAR